ncbi:UDP-N-acetylglucosamine 2-epimerase (non-hydrolyzing) [Candidatus Gracilibacteria bacterium]|nr:UDP-N-acetylglucosamine 2-epimerase (non-hydrolyzing) [Candidatus Gracilibacteria bacterium]
MTKVLTLLGTRPEIIKLSPLIALLVERFEHVLVHSGQHYSYEMDAQFFAELRLPTPTHMLNVGSASHGEQLARMLSRLEPLLHDERPDVVLVQGDTNTTLAGGLGAAKLNIPVVHVEAGCRSFNRAMPEELNRVLVDHLASALFVADEAAQRNLRNEGIDEARCFLVGSTAIDACERNRAYVTDSTILNQHDVVPGGYLALTVHRAENTHPAVLPGIIAALETLAERYPIVFPVHPRTAAALAAQGLQLSARIRVCPPLGYIDMLRLVGAARALLTDSGGLQEEAAVLGTPALILRQETEWQALVDAGFHILAGNSTASILATAEHSLSDAALATARSHTPHLRGGASQRICDVIAALFAHDEQVLAT